MVVSRGPPAWQQPGNGLPSDSRMDVLPGAQHSHFGSRIPPKCHGGHVPWQGWMPSEGDPLPVDILSFAPSPPEQFQLCPWNHRQGGTTGSKRLV